MRRVFFDVLEINIAVSVIILVLCVFAGKLRNRYGAQWMKLVWLLLAVRLLIPYNFSLPFTEIRLFNMPGFEQEETLQDSLLAESDQEVHNADINGVNVHNNKNGNTQILPGYEEINNYGNNGDYNFADDENYNYVNNNGSVNQSNVLQSDMAESIKAENNVGNNESAEGGNDLTESSALIQESLMKSTPSYSEIMAGIWLFGVLGLMVYYIFGYVCFCRNCKKTIQPVSDKEQFFYDMELACDGSVLLKRNEEDRESYARVMLSFAGKAKRTDVFSTAFGANKKRMKDRIDYMLDSSVRKKGYFSIVVAGVLILTMSLVVSCGYKPDETATTIVLKNESTQKEPDLKTADTTGNSEAEIPVTEPQTPFEYNHEYNEMIRVYRDTVYVSRPDGIYCIKDGETEELIYENTYALRRGMELYQDFLFFCGSAQRGDKEAATIYRMDLKTHEVTDALALYSQIFEAFYNISVYEDKLYVSSGYGKKIGFELNSNGEIGKLLDDTAEDFLYKEYNDYMELELNRWNVSFDSEEYWKIVEEQETKYRAALDVASCKKMLDGKQVVSQYKDEMLVSLYLENEDGTYEYLCDSVGAYPLLITETGIYYMPKEDGKVWYIDYETKKSEEIYGENTAGGVDNISLMNYDSEYIYLLKYRHIGEIRNGDTVSAVYETYIIRVPRQGGEAEKVYYFEEDAGSNGPLGMYRRCAVHDGKMYFEEHETISLNPNVNGMQEENRGS